MIIRLLMITGWRWGSCIVSRHEMPKQKRTQGCRSLTIVLVSCKSVCRWGNWCFFLEMFLNSPSHIFLVCFFKNALQNCSKTIQVYGWKTPPKMWIDEAALQISSATNLVLFTHVSGLQRFGSSIEPFSSCLWPPKMQHLEHAVKMALEAKGCVQIVQEAVQQDMGSLWFHITEPQELHTLLNGAILEQSFKVKITHIWHPWQYTTFFFTLVWIQHKKPLSLYINWSYEGRVRSHTLLWVRY